jgi:hypothetical protein
MMMGALFAGVVLAAAIAGDTVVAVQPGDRFVAQNLSGELLVGTWDRDEVQAISDRRGTELGLQRSEGAVHLRVEDRRGRSGGGSYQVTVPTWMGVELTGGSLDVNVRGVRGGVIVQSVEGDVTIREVAGDVSVRSVDGMVHVQQVEGTVEAYSADDDVVVVGVSGSVMAESVDGDVSIRDSEGDHVRGVTVEGDVHFAGTLRPGGSYQFSTHDGDVTARIPDPPNAEFTVLTYDGDFESDFPITMERVHTGGDFRFRLGEGEAQVKLEAFDGEIRLLRGSG